MNQWETSRQPWPPRTQTSRSPQLEYWISNIVQFKVEKCRPLTLKRNAGKGFLQHSFVFVNLVLAGCQWLSGKTGSYIECSAKNDVNAIKKKKKNNERSSKHSQAPNRERSSVGIFFF